MAVTGNGALRVPQPHGGVLVMPAKGGPSRNPSGMSKERRELYDAIEKTQIPRVVAMLGALFSRGVGGDDFAAKLWLDHVRGPVKARDDDAISAAVQEQLGMLIQEARRRREEQSRAGAHPETSETDPPK